MSKIFGVIYYTLAGVSVAGAMYGAVQGNLPGTIILGTSAGLSWGLGKSEFKEEYSW